MTYSETLEIAESLPDYLIQIRPAVIQSYGNWQGRFAMLDSTEKSVLDSFTYWVSKGAVTAPQAEICHMVCWNADFFFFYLYDKEGNKVGMAKIPRYKVEGFYRGHETKLKTHPKMFTE